jgi:4-hydroxythreonine-4-phosphate dehydrogenase
MWRQREKLSLPAFFAVGPISALKNIPTVSIKSASEAASIFPTALPCFDIPIAAECQAGAPTDVTAQAAWEALKIAAQLALAGDVSAIVTAPISKAQMYAIGFKYPGQTEFFAAATNTINYAMMLAGPELRTVPLTIHEPIKSIAPLITEAKIITAAEIILNCLRLDFGIENPRLAICGLNPHAGENGSIGTEEIDHISPAIIQLRAEANLIIGPLPADSAFAPHVRKSFDAALCMYHDQALIPVKILDFDRTVNVTIGLPIIRTSPDHGTGFDIAGRAVARADSMIAALQLAEAIALNRRAKL